MAATTPVRFDKSAYPTQSLESADSFLPPGKTWTPATPGEKVYLTGIS